VSVPCEVFHNNLKKHSIRHYRSRSRCCCPRPLAVFLNSQIILMQLLSHSRKQCETDSAWRVSSQAHCASGAHGARTSRQQYLGIAQSIEARVQSEWTNQVTSAPSASSSAAAAGPPATAAGPSAAAASPPVVAMCLFRAWKALCSTTFYARCRERVTGVLCTPGKLCRGLQAASECFGRKVVPSLCLIHLPSDNRRMPQTVHKGKTNKNPRI